jgi:hypothetical protein
LNVSCLNGGVHHPTDHWVKPTEKSCILSTDKSQFTFLKKNRAEDWSTTQSQLVSINHCGLSTVPDLEQRSQSTEFYL